MKRFIAIAVLTCGLAVSAFAGDVPSVDVNHSQPEVTEVTTGTAGEIPSVPGDIPSDGIRLSLIKLAIGLLAF